MVFFQQEFSLFNLFSECVCVRVCVYNIMLQNWKLLADRKGTIKVEKGTWIKESWKVCICVNEIVFAPIKRSNICVWMKIKKNGKKSHHYWNIRVIIANRYFFLQTFVWPLLTLVLLTCMHKSWKITVDNFNENPKYYDVKSINHFRAGKNKTDKIEADGKVNE